MNILYHFRTRGSGAEGVHIAGIASAFEKLGHRVVFSSPGGNDPRGTAGDSPFSDKTPSLFARCAAAAPGILFELLEIAYNILALIRHVRLLSRENFDLIYERHAFFLCSTAWLARRRGVPLVVEVNELAGDERVRASPALLPLARLADGITFHNAQLVVTVSPHLRRRIIATGISEKKVLVLPNAVAEETLEARFDGHDIRRRYRCADATIVGFVGWFVPWHRLDFLVAEFATLARQRPELRLLLVGDGPLRGELTAQATAAGVLDRVIFAGPIAHAEVGSYIAAMDVAVVPHSNEYRSPIKLFETMARGRAVVAPRTEPIESVIQHEKNGLLFLPATPGNLAAQIARLIDNPAERESLGRAAQETVRAHHTWRRNADAVLAALHQA